MLIGNWGKEGEDRDDLSSSYHNNEYVLNVVFSRNINVSYFVNKLLQKPLIHPKQQYAEGSEVGYNQRLYIRFYPLCYNLAEEWQRAL